MSSIAPLATLEGRSFLSPEDAEHVQSWIERVDNPRRKRKRAALGMMTASDANARTLAHVTLQDSVVDDGGDGADADPDRTPTKKRKMRAPGSAPSLSSGRSSGRSMSPTKLAVLSTLSEEPIIQAHYTPMSRDISEYDREPPKELKTLWDAVAVCSRARKVIPSSLKAHFTGPLFDDGMFDDSPEREQLAPTLDDAERIRFAAAEITTDYESHWNSATHHRILYDAIWNMGKQRVVAVKNITQAEISPKWLLRDEQGLPNPGTRVDFALVLNTTPKQQDTLRRLGLASVNHTDYAPILHSPIAVSIEAKRTGEGHTMAQYQLSVWVAAHFRRLEALLGEKRVAKLPFLPLLRVIGPKWQFLAATRTRGETIVWGDPFDIGSMTEQLGVFQIFAALQSVTQWIDTTFREWFVDGLAEKERGVA